MPEAEPLNTLPRTVLITGASSGIGLELARLFAADGYRLVLTGLSPQKLAIAAEELRSRWAVDVIEHATDLARPDAVQQIVQMLTERQMAVDALVNNAGYGAHGPFAEGDVDEQMGMIQVNIAALTRLTQLLLPGMLQRKWGRVMNVASVAAFQAGPYMAVYYATKAYVLSFTEAIAAELAGTGITCTALCPGPTATGFLARARVENSPIFQKNMMDSTTVAQMGYDALRRGQVICVTGFKNKFLVLANRFLPRSWVRRVVKSLNGSRTSERRPLAELDTGPSR